MSDTFYLRQKNGGNTGKKIAGTKPTRKLKKDYISDVNKILNSDISGLDKCTIPTLENLIDALERFLES
jgi:hypothetical protein